ncbi:hypothetical protein JZM24_00075 [Candidatus Sodalis endolongispinus]|uniref:Transporter n=1 Tax=Candidatus Sodalis endolongispinus TaxID=2812662 RepID=A0ABS5Y7P2_9GAMM|nr:hypothetical protein [Candidatus Sodalis endolongispinus]MBT9430971.1 hypothetical protein [Candidatus Sodalis endolongispinus]
MQSDWLFVLKKLGVFLLCAVVIALLTSLLFIDINGFHNGEHESSLTEIVQELILVMIHGLLLRNAALRHSSALIGGFFLCMLIREMDFAFDLIRHGSRLWFALAVTLAALLYAGRSPQRTLAGLVVFFKHPSYGMLSAGLLTVLLFARLMGMCTLWHTLLADDFIRTVKNAVEEGTELFGYALCLLATLSYFRSQRSESAPVVQPAAIDR